LLILPTKNQDGIRLNNSFRNRVTETKKSKGTVLWYVVVLCWKLHHQLNQSECRSFMFKSDDVVERQSSPNCGQKLLSFFFCSFKGTKYTRAVAFRSLQQPEEQRERKCVKIFLMAWQSQWAVASSLLSSSYHTLDTPHVTTHWTHLTSLPHTGHT